jgi:hypothetical protein
VLLSVAQRIGLVNELIENNVTFNGSYVLRLVEISMNLTSTVFSKYSSSIFLAS